MRYIVVIVPALMALVLTLTFAIIAATAQDRMENYAGWPVLKSTFPSTGGGGIMIKGYDPVITGNKCVTTFMAVTPAKEVFYNVAEFDAVPSQGGTLCTNGKFKSFDGSASGATPFQFFFKDGVFRSQPPK